MTTRFSPVRSTLIPATFTAEHGPFCVSEDTLTVQAGTLSFERLQAHLDALRADYPQLFSKQLNWEAAKAACQQLSELWRQRLIAGRAIDCIALKRVMKSQGKISTWKSWCREFQIELVDLPSSGQGIRVSDRPKFELIAKLKVQRQSREAIWAALRQLAERGAVQA